MNANQIITLARKHVANGAVMESSARGCLADAIAQFDLGNEGYAKMWALKTLAYSVGVFHQDYKRAAA